MKKPRPWHEVRCEYDNGLFLSRNPKQKYHNPACRQAFYRNGPIWREKQAADQDRLAVRCACRGCAACQQPDLPDWQCPRTVIAWDGETLCERCLRAYYQSKSPAA